MKEIMKNKKIEIILYFIIISCFLVGLMNTAFAQTAVNASINSIRIDPDTQMMTVTGTVSPVQSKQHVTLRVLNDGKNIADMGTPNNSSMNNVFNYLYQTDADANGVYTFSYHIKPGTPTGQYTFLVAGTNISEISRTFMYFEPNDVKQIFVDINAAQSALDLKNIILSQYADQKLSLELGSYNSLLNHEDKDKVFENLYQIKKNAGNTFSDLTQLGDAFEQSTLVQTINELASSNGVRGCVENGTSKSLLMSMIDKKTQGGYQQYLNAFDTYSNNYFLNEDGKKAVFDEVYKVKYNNASDLWRKFNEQVIVQSIYRVNVYGDVGNILENNKMILSSGNQTTTPFNFDKYDKLSENGRHNVLGRLSKVLFSDFDDLGNTFNAAVDNQYDDEHQSNGGNAGGSSERSSTVTVNSPMPIVTPQPAALVFNDIGNVSWAYESINTLASKGIVSGYGDGSFRPDQQVTREQFIKMMINAFYYVTKDALCTFSDVLADDWSYEYIATAQQLGITDGIGEGRFGLGQAITRQEMATMAYRAIIKAGFALPDNASGSTFDDATDIEEYAVEPIAMMQGSGVLKGSNDMFYPENTATRAEACTVIFNLLKLVQKAD